MQAVTRGNLLEERLRVLLADRRPAKPRTSACGSTTPAWSPSC